MSTGYTDGLSFLEQNPELQARLLQWEKEAPQGVLPWIFSLRQATQFWPESRMGEYKFIQQAADQLGKMGPEAKGAILSLLEVFLNKKALEAGIHRDEVTLIAVQKALVKLGEPAVEPFLAALKEGEGDVREAAAEALKQITGQDLGEDAGRWEQWRQEQQGKARP